MTLYGSSPREIIWREQLGEDNPIPREYAAEAYGDCDCPICQMLREEIENAESDEAHGHCWVYSPDSCLLDRFQGRKAEEDCCRGNRLFTVTGIDTPNTVNRIEIKWLGNDPLAQTFLQLISLSGREIPGMRMVNF